MVELKDNHWVRDSISYLLVFEMSMEIVSVNSSILLSAAGYVAA